MSLRAFLLATATNFVRPNWNARVGWFVGLMQMEMRVGTAMEIFQLWSWCTHICWNGETCRNLQNIWKLVQFENNRLVNYLIKLSIDSLKWRRSLWKEDGFLFYRILWNVPMLNEYKVYRQYITDNNVTLLNLKA